MTEKQLQGAVLHLAKLLKLWTFHPWTSIHSASGWPDLCCVGPCGLIFVELKSEKGRISHAQAAWIDRLRDAGCEVHVWKPQQWRDGTVEARLKALAAG